MTVGAGIRRHAPVEQHVNPQVYEVGHPHYHATQILERISNVRSCACQHGV